MSPIVIEVDLDKTQDIAVPDCGDTNFAGNAKTVMTFCAHPFPVETRGTLKLIPSHFDNFA
jgi:hypothetical protein